MIILIYQAEKLPSRKQSFFFFLRDPPPFFSISICARKLFPFSHTCTALYILLIDLDPEKLLLCLTGATKLTQNVTKDPTSEAKFRGVV